MRLIKLARCTKNMIPEQYAIVAIWSEETYLYGRTWDRAPHYIFLGQTGPRAVSYWVSSVSASAKSKKLRVSADQANRMLTREPWIARWAEEVKAEEQAKIMSALSH